ncbi:MAG: antibiotic biosynthesis monooxygenase family protein [Anaerolineales bacterium]
MQPSGQLFTLGNWTVKPGREQEFIRTWDEFAKWTSQNQPGAGTAHLVQDVDAPNQLISLGPWESTESIAAWRGTQEFATFLANARELCEDIHPRTLKVVAQTGNPLIE